MSAADSLKFDKDAMQQSSKTLAEARSAIASQLAGLTAMSARIGGEWTGEANLAFTRAHAKWDAEFARMSSTLETIADGLDAAAQRYDRVEKANGRRWPG